MTEYIPTTERVKDSYVWFRDEVTAYAARVEFDRWLNQVKSEAWEEGHLHRWNRHWNDGCICEAWSSSECGCGKYGTGELLSLKDNPYSSKQLFSASDDQKLGQCCAHCKDPHCYGCECDEDNE